MGLSANMLPTDGAKWTKVNGATVSNGVVTIPKSNGTTVPKASTTLDVKKVAACNQIRVAIVAEFAADYRSYSTLYMGLVLKNAETTKKYYFPFTTEPKRMAGVNKWLLNTKIDKPYEFSTVTSCTVFFETSTRNTTVPCIIRNPSLQLITSETDLLDNADLDTVLSDYTPKETFTTTVNGLNTVIGGKVSADTLDVSVLNTVEANIDTLVANAAKIVELDAFRINAGAILAEVITTDVFEAATGRIGNLELNSLTADSATIKDLVTNMITTTTFDAAIARILNLETNSLTADSATIKDLVANRISVDTFNATYANVATLKAGLIDATSGQLKSIFASIMDATKISSDFLDVKTGFIKNAMIANLDVSKINAGTIYTDKIKISSPDGALNIDNNLLTVNDGNKVRVELGLVAEAPPSLVPNGVFMTEILRYSTGIVSGDTVKIEPYMAGDDTIYFYINCADYGINTGEPFTFSFDWHCETSNATAGYSDAVSNTLVIGSATEPGTISVTYTENEYNFMEAYIQILNAYNDITLSNMRLDLGTEALSNVYALRIRGKDGTTSLFDENGITPEGITDGTIVNEHVSNDTNISGNKLDVPSVVSIINSGTDSLNSSLIYFDEQEQQLDMFLKDTREVADSAITNTMTLQAGLNDLTMTFDESQVYELDSEGKPVNIKSKIAIIEESVDGLKIDVQQTGGDNLLSGSSARLGLDSWTYQNVSTHTSTLVDSRGYFKIDASLISPSFLAQTVDTVPGTHYAIMFKYFYYATGTASVKIDSTVVALSSTSLAEQLNFDKVYQGNVVADSNNLTLYFEVYGSELYVADIIIVPCTSEDYRVATWQQGPNELISGGIALGAGKMTITGQSGFVGEYTDEYVKYLQQQSNGTFKEVVAFTTDHASFADTTIHGKLGIHRDGNESGMLSIIPDASGIFFAIND